MLMLSLSNMSLLREWWALAPPPCSSADPERSRKLLAFMLAHELVAVNTFDGCPGIVGEASAPDAQWTHMWYKDNSVVSNRFRPGLRQP